MEIRRVGMGCQSTKRTASRCHVKENRELTMEWSLSKAESEIPVVDTALDEHLKRNLMMTSLEDMLAWSRSKSLWPFNFGLSCCYVEMATSLTSRFDLARFGSEVIRATPRQADMIVISGTCFLKMAPEVQRLY